MEKGGDIERRMDLGRVIRDLRYLVQRFIILALGNLGDGTED